jgi:hypothetical protein
LGTDLTQATVLEVNKNPAIACGACFLLEPTSRLELETSALPRRDHMF